MPKDNKNSLKPSCGRCWHIHEKSEKICHCECHGIKLKPIPIDPFPYKPSTWDDRTRWQQTKPFNEHHCLTEAFFRNNPREKVALLSCPCPRCSIWC